MAAAAGLVVRWEGRVYPCRQPTKEPPASTVSRSIAPPRPPASSSELARVSEGSGSGGGGGGGGPLAAPFAMSLGVHHMLGRWLGASPSPPPSPAAAVGPTVCDGAAGARVAAAAAPVEASGPLPRNRRSKAAAADEEQGAISGEVSDTPTTTEGGGAFKSSSTLVFSPVALPGDEEAPLPSAAARKEAAIDTGRR